MRSHLSYNNYNVKIIIYNYIKTVKVGGGDHCLLLPTDTPLCMWAVSSVGYINTVSKVQQMASASCQTESCPYIIHYFWNVLICFQYSWIYRRITAWKTMLCYHFFPIFRYKRRKTNWKHTDHLREMVWLSVRG
jgi:hypothetical protein